MLIVRVKRRRDEQPIDRLCVVEDSAELDRSQKKRKDWNITSQLASQSLLGSSSASTKVATTDDSELVPGSNEKHLLLQRVTTLESGSRSFLDNITKQYLIGDRKEGNEVNKINTEQTDSASRKRARLVVSQGRSKIRLEDDQSYLVVDMVQTHQEESAELPPAKASKPSVEKKQEPAPLGTSSKPAAVKVLDPASRELEKGILLAMQKGDFNTISSGLMKGANPNYQIPMEKGGYTALMAAARWVNVRMVNRLLVGDVDVAATNASNQTALDMVKETSQNKAEAMEVRQTLQSALIRHVQRKAMEEKKKRREMSILSEEYVVDIYCMDTTKANKDSADNLKDTIHIDEDVQKVRVEGLRILDDGQVDILTYDSDWSDLADDEDVDSNDEKYEGNDYPEDEDSQEEDDEDNADEDEEQINFRQRKANIRSAVQGVHGGKKKDQGVSLYDNLTFDGEDSDVPLFERIQRVGKVMPKHFIGEAAAGRVHDTESLQTLWEMQTTPRNPHEERIEQMNQRTGMTFAANPREFDSSGLAKYGAELSDDDHDYYEEDMEDDRGMYDAEAYDHAEYSEDD